MTYRDPVILTVIRFLDFLAIKGRFAPMKYSLRSIIFAITLIGIILAWMSDRNRLRLKINELEKSNTHMRELIEIRAPALLDAIDYRQFE